MGVRIGVDTGGTFTDCVLELEDRPPVVVKVPSTPDDPGRAILHGVSQVCEQAGVSDGDVGWLAHGTTVATNAILQEQWSRVGLLTNRGCRDVLEIGTQMRPSLYSLHAEKPTPLVPRQRRLEVGGRIAADGSEVEPLDVDAVRRATEELVAAGVEAIAIAFLFSFLDPRHERQARDAVLEVAPELYVCISSEMSSEFREYPRTSTTVINAALAPVVRRYINRLEAELEQRDIADRLRIMQSNGGVLSAGEAADAAHHLILSGPAAGIIGAVEVCRLTGIPDALTFDMGGTSTDVGIIVGGEARQRFGTLLNDAHPVRVPMLDLHTVGAGGGSIAWIDKGGVLKVGPQSAGAVPGPACYGLGGTEPTVTDAYVALGRIDPGSRLGSVAGLDRDLAHRALAPLAERIGLSIEDAALGILDVATATMAGALRVVSSKRGHDPRDFALVAFGGAGPVHASALARDLGIDRILLPSHPGALSALGLLSSDLEHSFSAALIGALDGLDEARLDDTLGALRARGDQHLSQSDVPESDRRFHELLDIRYQGQEYALTVPLPEGPARLSEAAAEFHRLHEQTYGHAAPGEPLEIVNVRMRAIGLVDGGLSSGRAATAEGGAPGRREREVYFAGTGWTPTPVIDRAGLAPGAVVDGPVIVEQSDTTIVVEPGQSISTLPGQTLIIESKREQAA